MRVIASNLHDPHNKLLIKLNTLISYQPHVYTCINVDHSVFTCSS